MSIKESGYINNKGVFIDYVVTWYCNTNKLIHKSINELKMCKHCSK